MSPIDHGVDSLTGPALTGEVRDTARTDIALSLLPRITATAAVAFLLYIAARGGFFNFDNKPHLAALISIAIFLHLWTRPRAIEGLAVVVIATAVRLLYGVPHPENGLFFAIFTYGAFLGFGSLAVLAVQVVRSAGEERERRRAALTAGLLSPVAFMLVGFPLRLTIMLHPKTYDHFLYQFDASLGFQPSFLIGRVFEAIPALRLACGVCYDVILLVIAYFYIGQIVGKKRFQVDVVKVFLGTLFFGTMLYHICPAAGPVYAFGKAFPHSEPLTTQVSMQTLQIPEGPRNAMPSLHLACALLVWWNSRTWRLWGRALAGLFLALTALATMGLGEHYFIDLVVALPFTVAMTAATTTSVPMQLTERRLAVLGGGALTLMWLVLLRSVVDWAHVSPMLSWSMVMATVAVSIALEQRLARVAKLSF
jgi:membrane-associated phospholipid phosphatase